MPFQTGTATDYIDLLNKLVSFLTLNNCTAVAVAAGGAGYVVGDIVTVSGGTNVFPTTLKVTTIGGGGAVTGLKIWTAGAYSVNPANPAATTGGTGAGLTVNLTLAASGWIVNRNATYMTTEKEVLLEGPGSGAENIFVGIRTYRNAGTDAFNWELAGMTGFSNALPWELQPGISPGRWDSATPTTEGGAFVPLDDAAFPFWFATSGRRLIVFARPGTSYVQMYLGLINTFNTSTEWDYPLCVCGCSSQTETRFNSSRASLNSIVQPTHKGNSGGDGAGPCFLRIPDGTWQTIANYREANGAATASRTESTGKNLIPPSKGTRTNSPDPDSTEWFGQTFRWDFVVPTGGTTPTFELRGVPSTPTHEVLLWAPTFVFTDAPDFQIYGQYDTVYWCSVAGSGLTSEDFFTLGSADYVLFQGVNNANSYDFVAIQRL